MPRPSTWFHGYDERFFHDRGVLYRALYGPLAGLMGLRFLLRGRGKMWGESGMSFARAKKAALFRDSGWQEGILAYDTVYGDYSPYHRPSLCGGRKERIRFSREILWRRGFRAGRKKSRRQGLHEPEAGFRPGLSRSPLSDFDGTGGPAGGCGQRLRQICGNLSRDLRGDGSGLCGDGAGVQFRSEGDLYPLRRGKLPAGVRPVRGGHRFRLFEGHV